MRIELVADGLRIIKNVAVGVIDLSKVTDYGTYQLLQLLASNTDTITAKFTVTIDECPSVQVWPTPTVDFSMKAMASQQFNFTLTTFNDAMM